MKRAAFLRTLCAPLLVPLLGAMKTKTNRDPIEVMVREDLTGATESGRHARQETWASRGGAREWFLVSRTIDVKPGLQRVAVPAPYPGGRLTFNVFDRDGELVYTSVKAHTPAGARTLEFPVYGPAMVVAKYDSLPRRWTETLP